MTSQSEKRDIRIFLGATAILFAVSLFMVFGGVYMQVILHVSKAPLLLGIVAGILLAIPLELWNFSDPDTLYRVMSFQDRFLMVCFGFAIGVGAILLYALNLIVPSLNFGIKDFFVPGIIIGGIIFGAGVGVAGYFPGTVWIALGQGRRDAIWALLGGLLGAFTWSVIFGPVKWFFWNTLNYGPITWASIFGITSKIGIFDVALIFGI
ncbi:MAG: YeeE/YedE family protein, partial [Nitrososphaerota archaeon]|nr:YeeE/YedE family protein [Nitrososphaerota archaeon]